MANSKLHDLAIFQLTHQCNQFINSLEQVKIWSSVDHLFSVIHNKEALKFLVDEMPQSDAKDNLISVLGYDDELYIKVVAASIPFLKVSFQFKALVKDAVKSATSDAKLDALMSILLNAVLVARNDSNGLHAAVKLLEDSKKLDDDANKHLITSSDLPKFEHFIFHLRMCGFGLFSYSHSQETLDSDQGMAYLADSISQMMLTDHESATTLARIMKSRVAALNEKSLNYIKREISPYCASDVINYLDTGNSGIVTEITVEDFRVGLTYKITTKDWKTPSGEIIPGKEIVKTILEQEMFDDSIKQLFDDSIKQFLCVRDIEASKIHFLHPKTIKNFELYEPIVCGNKS
ncbi:hypothetical protein [Shewanella glacialipiscicola]|uniref:hypothetical protein n=1 Tax=Shewanella glacialipiscicola TaxID=614069 RepID=UPI003D7ACE3A